MHTCSSQSYENTVTAKVGKVSTLFHIITKVCNIGGGYYNL